MAEVAKIPTPPQPTAPVAATAPAVTDKVAAKPVEINSTEAKSTEAKSDAAKLADAKPAATLAAVQVKAPAKRKYVRKAATNVSAKPAAKTAAIKAKPVAVKAKPVAAKVAAKIKAAPAKAKAAKAATTATTPNTFLSKLKEATMVTSTKKTAEDMTAKFQDTIKDVQARAKIALEKSQAVFGEAGEFTKGNIEAMVESGKIIATGVQAMGKSYVAEVKASIETAQADAKELRSAKSPTDFVKLQSTLMRKYFDGVVAYNSKNAETVLKLANEAFQPISSRVSLAVEKVKKAA